LRNCSFCISLLAINGGVLKKLNEYFEYYREALGDKVINEHFLSSLMKIKKNTKIEKKEIEEYE
jgi:hypothetical protein